MKTQNDYFGDSLLVQQHLAEDKTKIEPGDWYIAKRNGPPQVLKCQSVDEKGGWINPSPETPGYSFDIHECRPFKKSVPEETMKVIADASRTEVSEWKQTVVNVTAIARAAKV